MTLNTLWSEDIVNGHYELEAMADRLAELGWATDVARETRELLLIARQFDVHASTIIRRLQGVWHAVERWDERNTDEEPVREALAKYRERSTGGGSGEGDRAVAG